MAPFNAKKETGGLVNLMELQPEYPVSRANLAARKAVKRRHPKLRNMRTYNLPLELFFKNEDPDRVLMIAGLPLEDGTPCPEDYNASIAYGNGESVSETTDS